MKKILALVFIMFFISCNQIKEGEVYKKQHEPERMYMSLIPMVVTNGETTTTIMVPVVIYDDEDWIIYIRKFDEDKNEFVTAKYYVTDSIYNMIHIGDWFVFDEDYCELDDPDIKRRKDQQMTELK